MKAINIQWDIDDAKDLEFLPTEIEIPNDMKDDDEIGDYLSDVTGFCHKGYTLKEGSMKYSFAIAVSGFVTVEVEADNFDEAEDKANKIVSEIDFGRLESIDWEVLPE